jgi:hypothetical protein
MSRGPGRIERAIRSLLDSHPDLAFVTADLVRHCYPGVTTIERKHDVSVLRAAQKVMLPDPDWYMDQSEMRGRWAGGGVWVLFNRASLKSYALGQMIKEGFRCPFYVSRRGSYGSGGYRHGIGKDDPLPDGATERITYHWLEKERYDAWFPDDSSRLIADLPAMLCVLRSDRYQYARNISEPDGRWFHDVRYHQAKRRGDVQYVAEADAKARAEFADATARLMKAMGVKRFPLNNELSGKHLPPPSYELLALAERIRSIAAQNDPDTVRAGLADIAAELEALRGVPA